MRTETVLASRGEMVAVPSDDLDRVISTALGEDKRAHLTLTQSVTEKIRRPIIEGQLPPGTPLRTLRLAAQLGVSVMPVREALRILEAEGLVTFTPHHGARVAQLSEEDIEEIYLVRGVLEGLAARLAVQRITAETLEVMREEYQQMQRAWRRGDLSEFVVHDRAFHDVMYRASGRPRLVKKILDLWDASRRMLAITYRTKAPMEAALASHRAILEACMAHDERAAERMTREHTEQAAARMLAALRADALPTEGATPAAAGPAPGHKPSRRGSVGRRRRSKR